MKMSVRKRAEYKLHYFDLRGRAEIARLILAYAKVPYDDIRYQREEWPEHKSKMPFGQLPVLEWKGLMLPQSRVIARFLAHRHGLGGSDEWESAQIDAYVAFIHDAAEEMRPVFMARDDEAKMKEALDHYVKTAVEPMVKLLEQRLIDNGTGFLVGNRVSLADLVLFSFYETNRAFGVKEVLTKSEQVTKLYNRVGDIPSIKEWINKRPMNPY